ncbi:MAG: hypothetical protein ABIH69_03750 [bacterium]|nr:hypothetical protein [Candidatus Margulisiibacteriota bacterium]
MNLTREDGKASVLIEAMPHEQNLCLFLQKQGGLAGRLEAEELVLAKDLLNNYIRGQKVLVVPAYSVNAFLFKLFGAREVVGVDADQRTISWLRAIANNFNYREIGEIFMSFCRYPNIYAMLNVLPGMSREAKGKELLSRIQEAVTTNNNNLGGVRFLKGFLGELAGVFRGREAFRFIYVPFLLGIKNGVEDRESISKSFEDIWEVAEPGARVMIAPFAGSDREAIGKYESEEKIIDALENIMPKDKFTFVGDIFMDGVSAVILEVIK